MTLREFPQRTWWEDTKAAIWTEWGGLINSGTSKATPVDADAIALMDSAASNATKTLTWANLKATILLQKLSAFASTTSAELATVISDELGSGNLMFGTEGTFTPVLRDAAAGNAASTTNAVGRYQKIGNWCRGTIHLVDINTAGLTAGNQVVITGLPFTRVAGATLSVPSIRFNGFSTATGTIQGYITGGQTYFTLEKTTTTGATGLLVSDITSGTADLSLSFEYETA